MDHKKEFSKFIKGITPKDKVAIFHDIDADGLTATALTEKSLKRLGRKVFLKIGISSSEIIPNKQTIARLKKEKITKLITLDKPVDLGPEAIKQIEKFADILIIDHHKIFNEIASEKTTFIKPQFYSKIEPGKYPTSKMVYDLFSDLKDISNLDWIAVAGVLGDAAEGQWKEFVDKAKKKYGFTDKDTWQTPLGWVTNYVDNAACYSPDYHKKSLKVLIKARTFEDIFESELKEPHLAVKREIEYHLRKIKTDAEFIGDMVIYQYSPQYRIGSIISTVANIKIFPKKTVVIMSEEDGKMRVNTRRNDFKKDMSKMAREATKGFEDAGGGGHFAAAGARFPKKYLTEFKKRIIKINSTL